MRSAAQLFLAAAVVALFLPHALNADELVHRIDGRVLSVDVAKQSFAVEFTHPATGEVSEMRFRVSESASFKNVKGLAKLSKGDLVTVDYVDHGLELVALYVNYVPLGESVPFTKADVAKALLKIGSQKSD